MADAKYVLDTSDLIKAQRDIKKWKRANSEAFDVVDARMLRMGKTSEVAFNQFGRAASRAQQKMKRFGSVGLQQVGYQVGDFAVQLQGGTNAAVAFGQQGSQLLGIFGPGGAIAGAGLAIVTAFVAPMIKAKEAASDFEDRLKSTEGAVKLVQDATDNAGKSIRELREEFGRSAETVASFNEQIANLAVNQAERRLQEQLDLVNNAIKELSSFASVGEVLSPGMNKLASDLGLNFERAEKLQRQFSLIASTATDIDQKSAAFNEIAIQLRAAGLSVEDLPADLQDAMLEALELAKEANRLKEALENSNDLAVRLGSNAGEINFNAAVTSATKLAEKLGVSVELARILQNTQTPTGPPGFLPPTGVEMDADTPRQTYGEKLTLDDLELPSFETKTSGGSSGGGGMSAAEKQAQELERAKKAVDQLRASYDKAYATELKVAEAKEKVNKLIELNPELTNEANQVLQDYIASLNEAENPMQKIADTMRSSLGDAFMSIVDGSKFAGEAFKDMARLVLKQAFELLVIKPILDSLFGSKSGGGGGIGGLVGSLLGQKNGGAWNNGVQMYANGGVVTAPTGFQHSGGLGVMGEAGPEAIMPLKRGKNGKLGVQSEQSPIPVDIRVSVDNNGNLQAFVDQRVGNGIQRAAPEIINASNSKMMDRRRRGGAVKATFG